MNKTWLKITFKLLVAAVLLTFFLLKSDIKIIINNLLALSWPTFILAIILIFLAVVIKTVRWRMLLPQYSWGDLFRLSLIGQYYSFFLAGQVGGEVAKIYILCQAKEATEKLTVSVIIDKIVGIMGLVLVAILGLLFASEKLSLGLVYSFFALIIVCLLLLFFTRWQYLYKLLVDFYNRLSSKHKNIASWFGWFDKTVEAWHIYSTKVAILFWATLLSILLQLVMVMMHFILAKDIGVDVSFFDWCWILGVLSTVLLLPITIGGVGLREGTLLSILAFYSVPTEQVLALSFSIFGVQLILALVGGAVEMFRFNIVKPNI